MKQPTDNLARRLEISDRIHHLHERICVLPDTRDEALRAIERLESELRWLEGESRRRKANPRLN